MTIEVKPTCMRRIAKTVEETLKRRFYHLGYFVAGRPLLTIFLCLLVTVACSSGFSQRFDEKRTFKLWVPQDTAALRQKEWVDSVFVEGVRPEFIIFTAAEENGDISTKAHLQEMIQVMKVSERTISLRKKTLSDLCFKTRGGASSYCSMTSVLDLFYDPVFATANASFFEIIEKKLETLSDAEIKQTISQPPYKSWNNRSMAASEFMGGVEGINASLRVQAFRAVILLEEKLITEGGDAADEEAESWEEEWLLNVNVRPIEGAGRLVQYTGLAIISFRDSIRDNISGDLKAVIIGYVLLMIYVLCFMGEFHSVKSRILLGFAALIGVVMSYAATGGIASYLGIPSGPVHQVLPLLLLGIGMDDAFVIVSCYDALSPKLPERERVARALSKAGAAISVTSITNASAFFIASITRLPALGTFALWAGIGILFDFVFQSTFFIAVLTFDNRRQASNRYDVVACVKKKASSKALEAQPNVCGLKPGVLSRFFQQVFGNFVLWRPVKIFFLVASVLFLGCSVYGLTLLKQDFQPEYFYVDDSYQDDFNNLNQQYFTTAGDRAYVYTGNMEYPAQATQQELKALYEPNGILVSNSYVEDKELFCWYPAFLKFTQAASVSSEDFYRVLDNFLNSSSGRRFTGDIVFYPGNQTIQGTRCRITLSSVDSNDDEVTRLDSLRASLSKSKLSSVFAYTLSFLFVEQYAVLESELLFNLLASVLIVFVISFLMIGNPVVAGVVMLSVGLSVVDIFGIMYFGGIELNSVSIVYLAVAVGLTIDSSLHLGLAFMENVGTREERTIEALADLGPPLVHGVLSTFLAISVVGVARSYVFAVFFKMFMVILLIGFFHGMVIVPQVLSWIGPPGYFDTLEEKQHSEEAIYSHSSIDREVEFDEPTSQSPKVECTYEQP